MKKVSFPTSNRSTIDEHFGHTKEFVVYTIDDNAIVSEEFLTPPPHEPGVLPKFLADNNVNVIITGGMGAMAVRLFNSNNIDVVLGAGGPFKDTLEEYLKGTLFSTGSSCNHEHGDHAQNHGH